MSHSTRVSPESLNTTSPVVPFCALNEHSSHKETDLSDVIPTTQNAISEQMSPECEIDSESNVNNESESKSDLILGLVFKKFDEDGDEKLFRNHMKNQKVQLLDSFICFSFAFSIFVIIIRSLSSAENYATAVSVHSIVALADLIVLWLNHAKLSLRITSNLSYVVWTLFAGQILSELVLKNEFLMSDEKVLWVSFLIYVTFTVMPVRLFVALLLGFSISAVHAIIVMVVFHREGLVLPINQVVANCLIFLAACMLGVHSFLYSDYKQRISFLEAKAALKVNVIIEREYKQHEQLLLSVLPKHVADEMIGDLGSVVDGQFRKIYMTRHENVSILFADIVGFTEISSCCTAAELIKVLNELFATFDKLANKFHQLRIKILGDCYYCVCGSPNPRPDHAVLSIHTGLHMVDAIKEVREKMQKNVNMRVGIHTGAVLGGVLGQRQFQYDVLGAEVILANKMESSGVPGRVHISNTTKHFLKNEFELEAGHGEDREDYIRLLGITTYLVKSILKPYPQGTLDDETVKSIKDKNEDGGTAKIMIHEDPTTHTGEGHKEIEFSILFSAALAKMNDQSTFSRSGQDISLRFKDRDRESKYTQRRGGFVIASVLVLGIICLLGFCARVTVLPVTITGTIAFILCEVILVSLVFAYLVPTFLSERYIRWFRGCTIVQRPACRMWCAITAVIMLVLADVVEMFGCDAINEAASVQPDNSEITRCLYSTYFVETGSLILIGITCLVQIGHITKIFLLVIVTATYCSTNIVVFPFLFDEYDENVKRSSDRLPTKYMLSASLVAVTFALAYLNRQVDAAYRRLFLWREQAEQHKEKVFELRHKNQKLLYCLLPAHVAHEFIGHQKNDEELYSQAYEEVGVIFAACPNFHDFYNESKVNKNGLECFRFLNEIISDYDELLSQPRFSSICKIKTVGTTYMAASGLTTDSSDTQWKHLDMLVQFAFLMKKTLAQINEQSFNNFIMRIGINHGPVIAGVIGAKKPHYDIWGNTVNVASRMESTGRMGEIQITKETKTILKGFGYTFEKRGLIKVKGKGEMMTYFIINREDGNNSAIPNQVPPS